MSDMEADHIIAKTATATDIAKSKTDHGLPANFDLESLFNLVPAHAVCNNSKSNRILPSSPSISFLFVEVASKEPIVREMMESLATSKAVERALAALEEIGIEDLPDVEIEFLRIAARDLEAETLRLLGVKPASRHPLIQALPPKRRWAVAEDLNSRARMAVVSDGIREGVTGEHESWLCPNGHPGPWNGIKCLTCGAMVPPDID